MSPADESTAVGAGPLGDATAVAAEGGGAEGGGAGRGGAEGDGAGSGAEGGGAGSGARDGGDTRSGAETARERDDREKQHDLLVRTGAALKDLLQTLRAPGKKD